ncbi:MC/SLC25 family protein [Candidatus Bathyarchaeota archaeon]|nr:MC/SLC25 family protein [Candidatus Bathyarchaeota archaeon]
MGKYIEYPFDTVKVRLQSQPSNLPLQYTGPLDCFRQSIKADGLRGLYRGISAPLAGAALENSSLFYFERVGRDLVYASGLLPKHEVLPLPALYFTGAFAGAFTSLVLTPVELVKCKIQVPATTAGGKTTSHLRPIPVIKDIYRHNGLRGFFHGGVGTLIREAGGGAAWFGAKETASKMFYDMNVKSATTDEEKKAVLSRPLPLWQQGVAGASGGVSYNFLFFPADTIKSRMQTAPIGESVQGKTFVSEGASLWKQHGLRGMYRGCGITCLRSAPSSAFIFMVFDGLKTYFPLH